MIEAFGYILLGLCKFVLMLIVILAVLAAFGTIWHFVFVKPFDSMPYKMRDRVARVFGQLFKLVIWAFVVVFGLALMYHLGKEVTLWPIFL